jgi:hypothetical protein
VPVGLLVPVVLVGWGAACALTCWRRLGAVPRVPALVASELPFAAGYLLIASLALALSQGNLDSVAGAVIGAAGDVVLVGLAVIVRRALRANPALGNADPASAAAGLAQERRPDPERLLRRGTSPCSRCVLPRGPPYRRAGRAALPRRRLPLREQEP